jgi:alkanesulfonate monooxygenase
VPKTRTRVHYKRLTSLLKDHEQHGGGDGGALRQLEVAERGDRHDRALYMATSTAIGGGTDSTALVGTPDTVVAALLDYADLGVTTFLNRGYDPLYDAVDYGRWIIPVVKEELQRRERHAREARDSRAASGVLEHASAE